jgi:hypothetical protein
MCPSANLYTFVAETVLPCDREAAFRAVSGLVDLLWGGMVEVVLSDPPAELLHRLCSTEGDVDVWVTWQLTAESATATRVRLVVEEADTSPGPEPELEEVLALLVEKALDPGPSVST